MTDFLVVSCEHGGNQIPSRYRYLFCAEEDQVSLESHRGFDAGALTMAKHLANRLAAPLVTSTVSRLLVDLNRSLGNPRVYSPMVRRAPGAVRRQIADKHYHPYRTNAECLMREGTDRGRRVIHVSCHSFSPELDGHVRNADIGLLYDPARTEELNFCKRWQAVIKAYAPELKVRRNYPYVGKNDGFTTHLRRCFSLDEYIGIELEINQKHVLAPGHSWAALRGMVVESLRMVLGIGDNSP